MKSLWLPATAVAALLALPLAALAQVPPPDEAAFSAQGVAAAPQGTANCFDYYRFGSVQAKLTALLSSAVSGSSVTFSGELTNENPYPIVDGSLYVKVFKSRPGKNDGNGPDVVAQFLVKSGIAIPANGSAPVSFSWKVPSYAESGNYTLATFFTTSRKFNLLGLSFTDDIVGNTVPFSVSGEVESNVAFDKAGVILKGKIYLFAAFPPRIGSEEPADIRAKIVNTTAETERTEILWTVYQWDAQLRENAVQEETQVVTVPAHGSAYATLTVNDARFPVYLSVGTLKWKDTGSIIGVRFVREGVDRTRINFRGVTSYPLKKGQESTLFSCLHNSGQSAFVSGGRLELALPDASGEIIHEYTYEGDVSGAMMGVAERFTPTRDHDRFTLEARLYQGSEFVDEARLEYDCEELAPGSCAPEARFGAPPLFSMLSSSGGGTLLFVGAGALVLALGGAFVFRRAKKAIPTNAPQ